MCVGIYIHALLYIVHHIVDLLTPKFTMHTNIYTHRSIYIILLRNVGLHVHACIIIIITGMDII